MSTAHEAIVAAYCGFKTLAISIITDMAVDEFDNANEPNHEEICKIAKMKTKDMERLVLSFIQKLDENRHILE
jgi:purine nucleoside phosphorylase